MAGGGISYDEAERLLTAPGARFELAEESVLGERLPVFAERPRSLRRYLEDSAVFGDAEMMVWDDGRVFTFADHQRRVASTAAALADRFGIGPGDRVAILAANCPEWIVSFWATAALGAIAVAMNGWWQGDEIRYGLELTAPKLLIADEKRLARIDWPLDGPVVVVERDFDELWRSRGATLPDQPIDEDDPVAIIFTSGTTGRPKGAVSTHRNHISFTQMSAFWAANRAMQLGTPPRPATGSNICNSPLFHVSGLQGGAIGNVAGGRCCVWTTGRFDPGKILELTVKERITRIGGVTTQLWRVLEHPDFARYDLSHVTATGGGGAVFSPELQRTIRAKLPNATPYFNVGYGSTETGGLCTMASSDMLAEHPDTVGRALPTAEVAIFDEAGCPLPDGRIGHVCVRGPMVTPGYWNNPAADADAFFPGRRLKTGDYGHLDGGLLYLASRQRDMIIRGGENIYPVEIENRLDEHPAISEAAVVGVDHRTLGQEVKAIVVARPGASIDPEEVRAFVAETLAYFKVPAHVEVRVEPLPRNATGKVLKHVLLGQGVNTFIEE